MFKGTKLSDFNKTFKNESDCKKFLFHLKWGNGYQCRRCGGTRFTLNSTNYNARCASCRYSESPTANTNFRGIQFPLLTAFRIAFQIVVFKKGISTVEISEIFGVNQKTAWLFKRKLQHVMMTMVLSNEVNGNIQTERIIDGIILSHRSSELNGLQRVQVEKVSNKARKGIGFIFRSAHANEVLEPCQLLGGKYIDIGKDLMMWNFRTWLTGTHHHCSHRFLQGYLSEFSFKHHFRNRREVVWTELMRGMMSTQPYLKTDMVTGLDNRRSQSKIP